LGQHLPFRGAWVSGSFAPIAAIGTSRALPPAEKAIPVRRASSDTQPSVSAPFHCHEVPPFRRLSVVRGEWSLEKDARKDIERRRVNAKRILPEERLHLALLNVKALHHPCRPFVSR
jgi:hypothetical protein